MKKDIKLAIIGSRGITSAALLDNIMIEYILPEFNIVSIISGGARGVDSLAENWADRKGVDKLIFPADWKKYGKSAGYRRNHDIIKNSDLVLALWDGQSRGTQHSMGLAETTYHKPLKVFVIENNKITSIYDN